MTKMLIIGRGWLGESAAQYFKNSYEVEHFKEYIDSAHENSAIHDALLRNDIVVNMAGKTNIDWCERHIVGCYESNVDLPRYLAEECQHHSKYLVHFSSACIFESYTLEDILDYKDENSYPNPVCFYTETKVMSERLVTAIQPYSLIPRIRLPISAYPHPRNTLDKLEKYKQINDTQESLTVVEDMYPVLKRLIDERQTGVVHLINDGTISPAEMALALGYKFEVRSKRAQDADLKKEGRAHRVTAYVRSNRVEALPHIKERFPEIVKMYKEIIDRLNTNI